MNDRNRFIVNAGSVCVNIRAQSLQLYPISTWIIFRAVAHTVACESPELESLDAGGGLNSSTSSAASSSISVVSVPLEVTGDGPTMSLGLGLIN